MAKKNNIDEDEKPKRILTPLEKLELSQIKLVAVILMKDRQLAMVEESTASITQMIASISSVYQLTEKNQSAMNSESSNQAPTKATHQPDQQNEHRRDPPT